MPDIPIDSCDTPPQTVADQAPSKALSNRGQVVCAAVEVLALSMWIGGLVVIIGAVIPAVFNSFGMEPGGRFLTRVFDGYNRLTLLAVTLLGLAGWWRLRQPRQGERGGSRPSRREATLLGAMVFVAGMIIFVIGPYSITLQEAAFAAQGEVAKKAAYEAFFRIHTVVRGLYLLNLTLGVWLVTIKVNGWLKFQKVPA